MIGIALEGGAKCAAFTAGVLDVFMENGLKFDRGCGVSAGAGCLINYRSNQPGRSLGVMLPGEKKKTISVAGFLRNKQFIDLDSFASGEGFEFNTFVNSDMRTAYVATCCETGLPVYLEDGCDAERLLLAVKASCSVPVLCNPVEIDGRHYLDGSVSDAVGAEYLLEQGCDRVVAVLTRPEGAGRTDYTRLSPLLKKMYGGRYPQLYSCLMNRSKTLAAEFARMERFEKEGRVLIIRPEISAPPKFSGDEKAICGFYEHGRRVAAENLKKIGEFIS